MSDPVLAAVTVDTRKLRAQAITQVVCVALALAAAVTFLVLWQTQPFFAYFGHYVAGAFGLIAIMCLVWAIMTFRAASVTGEAAVRFAVREHSIDCGNGIRIPYANVAGVQIERVTAEREGSSGNVAIDALQPLADTAFSRLEQASIRVTAVLRDGDAAAEQAKAVARDWKDYIQRPRRGVPHAVVYLHPSLRRAEIQTAMQALQARCQALGIPFGR